MNNKNSICSLIEIPESKPIKSSKQNKYFGRYLLFASPLALFFILSLSIVAFAFYILNKDKGSVLSAISPTPRYNVYNSSPKTSSQVGIEIETKDARSKKVRAFFDKYGAPLSDYSDFIVEMADKYQIDWKLVSAIGYCEGNGGKKIPEGSFNTWGWGASEADLATKSGKYNMGSWENAIETVSKGLKTGYINEGKDTPFEIMLKYAPQSKKNGGSWAKCVESYMHEIDNIK